jgi:hypothetical protein
MKNRITAALTLISFLIFSWSCTSIRVIKPEVLAAAPDGWYGINKLETNSGEVFEYFVAPAQVRKGEILGVGQRTSVIELVEVESAGLEVVSRAGDPFKTVKTGDGRTIGGIRKIEPRGDKSILQIVKPGHREPAPDKVLLADISKAWSRRFDVVKTVLLITIPILGGFFILKSMLESWRPFAGMSWGL